MSGAMRDKMPECAAFIDSLREAFGREEIDNVIRRGLHRDCPPHLRFFATENGHVLGQPCGDIGTAISAADMVILVPKPEEATVPNRRRR